MQVLGEQGGGQEKEEWRERAKQNKEALARRRRQKLGSWAATPFRLEQLSRGAAIKRLGLYIGALYGCLMVLCSGFIQWLSIVALFMVVLCSGFI